MSLSVSLSMDKLNSVYASAEGVVESAKIVIGKNEVRLKVNEMVVKKEDVHTDVGVPVKHLQTDINMTGLASFTEDTIRQRCFELCDGCVGGFGLIKTEGF